MSDPPSSPLSGSPFVFGNCAVDTDSRRLLVGGRDAALGARAFDLLVALIERRDRVVGKSELLDLVWAGLVVEENNLQVQVSALRKLLGAGAIATIPGRGYRFTAGSGQTMVAAPTEPPVTLFGRDSDLAAVGELLQAHRLVTLVGPGGIGKTRLAQELARRATARGAGGGRRAGWVDLAAVASAEHVAEAVAAAAGVALGEGDPFDTLMQALAELDALLVLDNCEHVLDETARIAAALLRAAPRVGVLATSQVALGVGGERLYRLDALAVPPSGAGVDAAAAFGAIELLAARAREADRHFELGASNVAAAIELVRELDGLPLAIEMAAARLPSIGFEALRARLGDRLRLLRSAARDAPLRQQTLRATIEWSHALLDRREREVLRRLAVFRAGFSLESAQQVAAAGGLDEWDALDGLTALADRSLVQVTPSEPPRYRLLETVRMFALERLAEAGEGEDARQRHGAALARCAGELLRDYWTDSDTGWLRRVAQDRDDLAAAFEAACGRHDVEVAALTGELLLWSSQIEAVRLGVRARKEALRALLALASGATAARIWNGLARFPTIALEGLPRSEVARERLRAWRDCADPLQVCLALHSLAIDCARNRDREGTSQALAEARTLAQPGWPPRLAAWTAGDELSVVKLEGDRDRYGPTAQRALELAIAAGSQRLAARARSALADVALLAGEFDAARAMAESAVAELQSLDMPVDLVLAMSNLAHALLMSGELQAAREVLARSLPLAWRHELAGYQFDHLAMLELLSGRPERAAVLLGYGDSVYQGAGTRRQANEARLADQARQRLAEALGPDESERLVAQGASLSAEGARALAQGIT